MYLTCFKGRTNNAVKTRSLSNGRIVHNYLVNRLVYKQILFHSLLVGRGKLSNRYKHRTSSVRAGKALNSRLHHSARTGSVKIGHINVKTGKHRHRLLYGIGDIVKLKVKEYLMTAALDLSNDLRALRIIKLHTDLNERLSFLCLKLVKKSKYLFL